MFFSFALQKINEQRESKDTHATANDPNYQKPFSHRLLLSQNKKGQLLPYGISWPALERVARKRATFSLAYRLSIQEIDPASKLRVRPLPSAAQHTTPLELDFVLLQAAGNCFPEMSKNIALF